MTPRQTRREPSALPLTEERYVRHQGPMHGWFSLSYANYLVVPRLFIQEMPTEWQARLERCLEELHETLEPINEQYRVTVVGPDGKFAPHKWNDYRRGTPPQPRTPLPKERET